MNTVLIAVIAALFVFLLLGTPIAFALGIAALAGMLLSDMDIMMFVQRLYNTYDSFPLLAVPFFVLAGEIMQKGSMSATLLDFCKTLLGHLKGGLSQIAVLTCLFYGALSGSAPATTAAVGGIMVPAMEKESYPKAYATAVNSAAGSLGVMIPPSVPLIIYGSTVGCSISDLFLAGVVPGLLNAALFMLVCWIFASIFHYGVRKPKATFKERLAGAWNARLALMVPVLVLGGIYGGIVTPTEAGCVAVVYSLVVELFITKAIDRKKLYDIFLCSMRTTGIIFLTIATANALGTLLVYHNAHEMLFQLITGVTESKAAILFIIIGILLVLGMFVDTSVVILVMAPMLLPIVQAFGMSPIQFGLMMLTTLAVGFITPPVGLNLFVGCGISGVQFTALSRACLPFVVTMTIAAILVSFIPAISLCLL